MRNDVLVEIILRVKSLTVEECAWMAGWMQGYGTLGQPSDSQLGNFWAGYYAGAHTSLPTWFDIASSQSCR